MVIQGPGSSKIPLPKKFYGYATNCGVRKYRPDLGVLYSELDCVATAVYTKNTCHAAHIHYDKRILPSEKLRAIVTNSGQANTATGSKGDEDNLQMVTLVAEKLELTPDQVASASTGVIGVHLDIEKINRAIPELFLNRSKHAGSFATAIMTTDLSPKTCYLDVNLSGGDIRLTGICKGSGMIHPNMATMLGYILTDAKIDLKWAKKILPEVVDRSFNMISVDGETSPNDTVFLLANGASGVSVENSEDQKVMLQAMNRLAQDMAKSIAADGEGASKLIEVEVQNYPDEQMARKIAKGITISPLIKTAIHGEDPNWGRIYSRLGQEGAEYELVSNCDLYLNKIKVLENGAPVPFDYYAMKSGLSEDFITIRIDFKSTPSSVKAWGCDLTKKYVDINTEYN
ncbi:MAG: bifunctional ornithine acetyltransferase/N-acetylglutamate synthase [Halobacteriovoraceae bacterium]|nr:bifunctional ornithine acetyltransferase/N-acetylglutamate synthase [Halobacteriovoraceae bacterium]|tara:strand:- start:26200 stop:27399 length:1200 start_codon:yes stop_codon:yes gene_type:complete